MAAACWFFAAAVWGIHDLGLAVARLIVKYLTGDGEPVSWPSMGRSSAGGAGRSLSPASAEASLTSITSALTCPDDDSFVVISALSMTLFKEETRPVHPVAFRFGDPFVDGAR